MLNVTVIESCDFRRGASGRVDWSVGWRASYSSPAVLGEDGPLTSWPHPEDLYPGRLTMRPENKPLEKENHLRNHRFQV